MKQSLEKYLKSNKNLIFIPIDVNNSLTLTAVFADVSKNKRPVSVA